MEDAAFVAFVVASRAVLKAARPTRTKKNGVYACVVKPIVN